VILGHRTDAEDVFSNVNLYGLFENDTHIMATLDINCSEKNCFRIG